MRLRGLAASGCRRMRRSIWLALAVACAFNAPSKSASADTSPAIELVLAVDVSGSVSTERFELQKQGYATAFRDERVIKAIRSASHGGVAVTMTQWTGPAMQAQVVPWMHIYDKASAGRLADAIHAAPRMLFSGGTSISGAIDHAVRLLSDRPGKAVRRVIDVSGDGANNHGRPAAEARDAAVAANIVINGLPILSLDPQLDTYYRNNVVGGPGAFVIAAKSYEAFGEAIVRKLVLEIAERSLGEELDLSPPRPAPRAWRTALIRPSSVHRSHMMLEIGEDSMPGGRDDCR